MPFALPRVRIDNLIAELTALDSNHNDDLRTACLEHTHAICDLLAMGAKLEKQVIKLVNANNALRAAKLLSVLAEGGATMRRLKFSKMFSALPPM